MNSSIGMPEVSQNLGHDPPIVPSSPVDAHHTWPISLGDFTAEGDGTASAA